MSLGTTLFLLAFFLASMVVIGASRNSIVQAETPVIRVPSDYPTIQAAINGAQNGSIILVSSGTYHEAVVLNKTLTLIGTDGCVIEDQALIDEAYRQSPIGLDIFNLAQEPIGIDVTADNSTIIGMTVANCSAGIRVDHCDGSTVSGNNLTSNYHGIVLYNSNESLIYGNSVCSNLLDGIVLNDSYFNTISNNLVSSTAIVILDGAQGDGLHLMESSANSVIGNFLTENAGDDLHLEDSNNNTFSQNTVGPMYYYGPTIAEDSCANNTFFLNNIISIVPPFSPYSLWTLSTNDSWSFQGEGNYWADYSGLDNGNNGRIMGDGIGDTELPWHGVDNYPLISPVNPFPVLWNNEVYNVVLSTNNTICSSGGKEYGFSQSLRSFAFVGYGPANTTGYCNLTLPKSMLSGPWTLYISGVEKYAPVTFENETYTTISISYENVPVGFYFNLIGANVIPEYPDINAVFLILFMSIVALTIGEKKLRTSSALPVVLIR